MYEDINNVNDRSLLVLLENIRDRNKKENRMYERLSKIYVNNEVYNSTICSRFVKEGLMEFGPVPKCKSLGLLINILPNTLLQKKDVKSLQVVCSSQNPWQDGIAEL